MAVKQVRAAAGVGMSVGVHVGMVGGEEVFGEIVHPANHFARQTRSQRQEKASFEDTIQMIYKHAVEGRFSLRYM